jgi:hypothetical protein
VLLLLAVFLLGCTTNPEDFAKKSPEIQAYLKAHPHSKMTITSYSPATFSEVADSWAKNCGKEVPIKDYYVAEIGEDASSLKVLYDKSDMSFVCSIEEKYVPAVVNPNPAGNDLPSTACVSQRGVSCTSTQSCSGEYISATDSDRCCKGGCIDNAAPKPVAPVPCAGAVGIVACNDSQKCTQGFTDLGKYCGCTKCEAKVCADYGGLICAADTNCSTEFISVSDGNRCCVGACYSISSVIITEYDANV